MITLLTDFGAQDYFVPAVKGVISSLHPQAKIIDLTHEIPTQDIRAAAFTLGACYQTFPAGTIHLAVVDPGVGSARRAIVIDAGNHFFVGPDNGLFSFVYAREKSVRVFHANREDYFRQPISPTFHGRDVFAPLAAWLEKGIAPEALGVKILDYVRFLLPAPQTVNDHVLGEVIHVDHFGNCITNLTVNELQVEAVMPTTRLRIREHDVHQFRTHFAQSSSHETLFAYLGSAGFWEVGLWQDSAAKCLQFERGAVVQLWR
jgi:S-adenosyl-L-methionine hydrolase (adenosine-forming)